jgi:hypothetical protein
MMKRIIYFISIVLVSALYSCSGLYDNIGQYATEETVYVGGYDDGSYPQVKIGYNRVEIDLMSERLAPEDIYMGKAKKTIVEYEELDGPHRRVFDSVCSWVNVTDLKTPKTYIFSIYAEDEHGNRSIAVETLGKPFTDDDLAGYSFPLPLEIPAPTTMDFRWIGESGLSSSLYRFAELVYSYVDRHGDTITGRLTSAEEPRFSIGGLEPSDNISVTGACKIIPIMESGPIIDTVTMVREFFAKTASADDYLNARTLRPIESAYINTANTTEATITWGAITDHLAWTEIEYVHSDGTPEVVRISNNQNTTLCTDIKRGEKFKIRCAFSPGVNDELITEWRGENRFVIKYERQDWVVAARYGNHGWGNDGVGDQTEWAGGHPMLILDDDLKSGWHSKLGTPSPQVLIIDMKESRAVVQVILYNDANNHGYWKNIEFCLTDNLPLPGYVTHTVNWDATPASRAENYSIWYNNMISLFPADVPIASWGSPLAQTEYKAETTARFVSVSLPQNSQGRYLIILFPNNNSDGYHTFIDVMGLEVYGE